MKPTRRKFLQSSVALAISASATVMGSNAMAATKLTADIDVVEADIVTLQAAMQSGKTTSLALVRAYLARIRAIDKSGPRINAVIELNPDAIGIARALDCERKAGKLRGPLHGIPVLIKDNIATKDAMQTTAGSLALVGARAPRDAFILTRLREAGAVILGKTNLSECVNSNPTWIASSESSPLPTNWSCPKSPHPLHVTA